MNSSWVSKPGLRPTEVVMAPSTLGATRLTRYSFARTLLRTAARDQWKPVRRHLALDDRGQGEAIYEWQIGGRRFHFVAFTQTLDEDLHTDRVVASAWEIGGALVDADGELDDDFLALLRREVPRQEQARLDERVLVLTRGNRSVRFFDALVASLASGAQPDPDQVADAGYIMRSTAFYGNGKFGMRSFDAFEADHPFAVPYRAQFAAAFLFRELSYDSVEHCARARGGDRAIGFDDRWRRFFGLGNATGLGLVPFAFKHPAMMNAWAGTREVALAEVRAMSASRQRIDLLGWWIERARAHFATGSSDDCRPFSSPAELVPVVDSIAAAFDRCVADPKLRPSLFDALYRWAEAQGPETAELVVALLIELHDGDDTAFDAMLSVREHSPTDPTTTAAQLRTLIDAHYGWVADLDLGHPEAQINWWVLSDNNEEPRRVRHDQLAPAGRDVAIDIAARVRALAEAVAQVDPATTVAALIADRPDLRLAIERVASTRDHLPYGEVRDDAAAAAFLPLQTQRFQLACYGMDNYKPKSTDWLRVTLFQGAPRLDDLAKADSPKDFDDRWVLPPRPTRTQTHTDPHDQETP